jgi:hypothetical protein
MSFETRTTTKAYPGADTQRTDFNDAAANSVQSVLDVPELIATTTAIITLTQEAGQSGNINTWEIVSGNGSGDFSLSNAGQLFRVTGHTLNGPYALVIRQTEGAPLFRFRDIELEVTTNPA